MTTFWKTMRLTISGLLFLLLLSPALAGCVTRNEVALAEAQARTDQARYQTLEAQARADAQIGVAKAEADAKIVREQETTERETAWLSTLPWLLLIVVLGGGLVAGGLLVLWFRGRGYLVQVQAQAATMLPAPSPQPALPQPREMRADRALPGPVAKRARETGTQAVPSGGAWLLVDVDQNVVEVMERAR
jgi:hypothetical protein